MGMMMTTDFDGEGDAEGEGKKSKEAKAEEAKYATRHDAPRAAGYDDLLGEMMSNEFAKDEELRQKKKQKE